MKSLIAALLVLLALSGCQSGASNRDYSTNCGTTLINEGWCGVYQSPNVIP